MESLCGNLVLLLGDLLVLRLARDGLRGIIAAVILGPLLSFVFVGLWSRLAWANGFLVLQLLCWWIFLHTPLILVWVRRDRVAVGVAVVLWLVAADAWLIEPRWLEVTRVSLPGPPMRIALVADLQTDRIGAYEEEVFRLIRAEDPDLVLFAGDYLQLDHGADREPELAKLRSLLQSLRPRLGGYAVQGDVEKTGWSDIFEGTAIVPLTETSTLEVGGLTLSGLTVADGRRDNLTLPEVPGFHLVLGHAPDFWHTPARRDLNLAGHTHGGQIQLPGIGPLITLADVSRDEADGLTEEGDARLYVSRGLGLERRQAPRIRFLCRPELVFITLQGG